jgi:hypothetical protein
MSYSIRCSSCAVFLNERETEAFLQAITGDALVSVTQSS